MKSIDIQQEMEQQDLNELVFGLTKICELFIEADEKEKAINERAVS